MQIIEYICNMHGRAMPLLCQVRTAHPVAAWVQLLQPLLDELGDVLELTGEGKEDGAASAVIKMVVPLMVFAAYASMLLGAHCTVWFERLPARGLLLSPRFTTCCSADSRLSFGQLRFFWSAVLTVCSEIAG